MRAHERTQTGNLSGVEPRRRRARERDEVGRVHEVVGHAQERVHTGAVCERVRRRTPRPQDRCGLVDVRKEVFYGVLWRDGSREMVQRFDAGDGGTCSAAQDALRTHTCSPRIRMLHAMCEEDCTGESERACRHAPESVYTARDSEARDGRGYCDAKETWTLRPG